MLTSMKSHRKRGTVTMLQRETPEFILPEMWPPNFLYIDINIDGVNIFF